MHRIRRNVFAMAAVFVPMCVIRGQDGSQHVAMDRPADARASSVLARMVTVDLNNVSLETAVHRLAVSAKVRITYEGPVVASVATPVTLRATHLRLGVALDRVLQGTGLRAEPLAEDVVTIQPVGTVGTSVADGGVSGKVIDAKTKLPVRRVTVTLDDAGKGVTTGDDGTFRIASVAPGEHVLHIRTLGYAKVRKAVTVIEGQVASVDVSLEPSVSALDQVVVTGTVAPTELKAVPNAITVITAKQIEERGITRIDQLFRGDVPGLFAVNTSTGNPLGKTRMFSRGATDVKGQFTEHTIKTYVDGVELSDPSFLSKIDPRSIERIEILTGPQASTIYGSNAMNGVMQIFTKRGATSAPQLTLNLQSGWIENNLSSARTPQHDYSAQLAGVEGRLSYNVGGSWNYMGRWNPSAQTSGLSAFGGTRLELPTPAGKVTADVSLRRSNTQNVARAGWGGSRPIFQETGIYRPRASGFGGPWTSATHGQTLGATLVYVPTTWLSQEVSAGSDDSDVEDRSTARSFATVGDSLMTLGRGHTERRTIRSTTTVLAPLTSLARLNLTVGADAWEALNTYGGGMGSNLTSGLTPTTVGRQPAHNAGGFLQAQLGFVDRLFLTYGLRAEWNPNFGADQLPNLAPRIGVAYTTDVGPITAKLRASYGRSTRPPGVGALNGLPNYISELTPIYGVYDIWIANPDLGPEYQQGGEGGLELYIGNRASLIVTRYNQTVDGLITLVDARDSVRSLMPLPPDPVILGAPCSIWSGTRGGFVCSSQDAAGYVYAWQSQNVNAVGIRNQGWELQGSVVTGPLTTRGTYSWTKSRSMGVTAKYRWLFPPISYPSYQPGATFQFLAEHTWALGTTYARKNTTVSLNVSGVGRLRGAKDELYLRMLSGDLRLQQDRRNMRGDYWGGAYISSNPGYALANLTLSHQLSSRIDGVVDVANAVNHYTVDEDAGAATVGRQSKLGIRCRF